MSSISLHESQSWTELTVVCVITGELRKLTQQPCSLILICQNQSLKVITMLLKKVTMKGKKSQTVRFTTIMTLLHGIYLAWPSQTSHVQH